MGFGENQITTGGKFRLMTYSQIITKSEVTPLHNAIGNGDYLARWVSQTPTQRIPFRSILFIYGQIWILSGFK